MGGFWYIRQQQSSKRAPPRDTIRFLHPTNRKLDGGRRQYPNQKILATKIDYKSAYRRGILHSITALKTATQLLDNVAAIITLRLIFGGAPCPIEWWGIFSETICNLANKVLKWEDWESADLHASVQGDIPPRQSFNDNTPFAVGRELIVDIPVDPRG